MPSGTANYAWPSAARAGTSTTSPSTPRRGAVRDSKDRNGPVLTFTPSEWSAFIGGVRDGEFDI
ncbi:DUF397 domain-containing protein [Microtetraspora sp. AC03309]|nr:DUF397 domain-containing protein [Microtetraspora sp. AC03309]